MRNADFPDVIVIGAGVIGLSVAIAAQARGLRVTVLDREGPAAGASAGNAGAFAFTDILPLASPGILRKAPRWLLDPLGPLTVPPAYALQIAPWMFGWYSIADPRFYTLALADRFLARGGSMERTEVSALRPVEKGVEILSAGGPTRKAARVVLAAGAFSHHLAATLGERIPLETERGYNTTLPADAFDLRMQITFGGHGFVVTRLSTGIRVGGAVELAGLKRPPNFARADAMLKKAQAFLPGLKSEGGTQWMGFRPSLPDSLPAIGAARATPNVVYAFGHGHLGLTQSPGTARLVADLLTGRPPQIDLLPFSPQRRFV